MNTLSSLSLFLFLLPIFVVSQDPFYINYDTNDGLPSSETYFAYADTNGLIWFATDRGVCTYDGYEFRTYTTKEGLSHNTNFRIFSDRKQRLWFTAWDGSISFYEKGKFTAIPLHKDTVYNESLGYAVQLLFDEADNIYVAKNYTSSSDKRDILFRLDSKDFSVSRHSVFDFEGVIWKDQERGDVLLKIGDRHLFLDKKKSFSVNVTRIDTSSWLVGFENFSLKFLNDKQQGTNYRPLDLPVNNYLLDLNKNLWVCTSDGLFLYKDANLNGPHQHFFKGLYVTSIVMDREGSYWMTSREKGVFWIPSFQFHNLLRPAGEFEIRKVLSIGKLSNHLLFGTSNDGILAVDKQFKLSNQLEQFQEVTATQRMYPSANTIYLNDFSWIKEWNGKLKTSTVRLPLINNRFNKELNNGMLLQNNLIGNVGYALFPLDKLVSTPVLKEDFKDIIVEKKEGIASLNVRVNCVEEVDSIIWLGGLDGLYQIKTKELLSHTAQKDTAEIVNVRIQDIIGISAQKLWIATIGNGLVFKNGTRYVQLSENDDLSSNLINKIYLENDSTIWVATNKGLDKVHFRMEHDSIKVQSIGSFSTSDGLVSNFINDVCIWKEQLWLATNKGINRIHPQALIENKTPPLIHLEEVLVGDRSIKEETKIELKHHENDLFFSFLGLSFIKPERAAFYRYRLIQNEKKAAWYYTNNRSIRFLDLAPGQYRFEVAAQNKNGYWSNATACYSFIIIPHFSDQILFRIFGGLCLALLIGWGFFLRIQTIQTREAQKRKLQDAELNVLRNQMNPHFIFNSLNSIQSFIFYKEEKKASYFLSKFSKLMRNSLEYSKLEYISIAEEIAFIRSYLELEKLRFDDRFEVEIEVAPELPIHDYFIPPLLLQPVLENAVKHAFRNIDYQGKLDIQFLNVPQKQLIQVVVKDNGVGMQNHKKKVVNENHQSMGLSIIESRIHLLNQNNSEAKAFFKLSNVQNANQEIVGTQALFILPIQLKRND